MKSIWIFAIAMLVTSLSDAAPTDDSGFKLLNFRAAPVGASHSGGESYSIGLSWNPEHRLQSHPEWSLGLNLGWIWFENQDATNFHSFELQPILGYRFIEMRIGVELGAGVQYWTEDRAGTYALLSGNVFYEFQQRVLKIMDRIFIGYSGYFLPKNFTHEIKIGVGLTF